jgi:hypothetical protein
MQLKRVTARGEEHGLINSLGNSVQGDNMKRFAPEHRDQMKKLKEEECRIVKARYINHRGTHERLTKPYCRWAGEPIQIWHFIPGQEYEVPLGLVNEVNDAVPKKNKPDPELEQGAKGLVEGKDMIHEFVAVGF